MRSLHEASLVVVLAIWVGRFDSPNIFGDWCVVPFAIFTLLAMSTGVVLVYRNRKNPTFLPAHSQATYAAATTSFAFIAGAMVHDVLDEKFLAMCLFWVLPLLIYVLPCLCWRYRQHRQASPRIIDSVLLAIAVLLLYDGWRWCEHSAYRRPDPFSFWFAGEGIYGIVLLASLIFIGFNVKRAVTQSRG